MNVLVIAPHMDDEVLGAGGAIAKHVENGDCVSVCIVANRAYNHKYDPSTIEEEQAATRQAQEILGYQNLCFLNLQDEQLDKALIDVIKPLEIAVANISPDLVYTSHKGDINQDHRAVFEATLIVCRPLGNHPPKRLLCYEVPSSTGQGGPFPENFFAPTFYANISTDHLSKKVEAMRCYKREIRPFPHPRSPEGIITFAKKRGSEIGLEMAEGFVVVRDVWT